MLILCLLFILDHGFGNWVRSISFCVFLLLSLLLFFLGLLSLGGVLASSTAENSSKEPKNGSSNGAVAADADATAAIRATIGPEGGRRSTRMRRPANRSEVR